MSILSPSIRHLNSPCIIPGFELSQYVSIVYKNVVVYIMLHLLQLANLGFNVVLISRSEEKLRAVAKDIRTCFWKIIFDT